MADPHRQRHLLGTHYGGWSPSRPDQRDQLADTANLKVRAEVDPRPNMPPVYDQLNLGSCTANAIAAAVQYNARLDGKDFGVPSRLFIYYGERLLEHSVKTDAGAYGRDGYKVCQQTGAPPEKDWPYDVSKFAKKPPAKAYTDAATHKIGTYKAVPRSVTAFKQVLSNYQTIGFGFTVYDSFESAKVEETGIVPMPGPDESALGGHEPLVVGYLKNEPNYALCRNSWGTSWGIGGYFLLPWAYLMDSRLASDFQTIWRPVTTRANF